MATIQAATDEKIFRIKKWLGLNESPDGDTGLLMGEASVMRNFRITREGHLQLRAGYAVKHALGEGEVRCLWSGYVQGENVFLAVCGGHLWRIDEEEPEDCGEVNDGHAFIFGFDRKAYILAGGEYYAWDGKSLSMVEGYVPLTVVACPPEGGGTTLEPINSLTTKRKQRFSPDGTETVFHLAETGIASVIGIERSDGGEVPEWTADVEAGTVTFTSAPAAGTDCMTVIYDVGGEGHRATVCDMKFAELYGGASDNRVFLYGDGTHNAIYSDLDEDGNPSAEYFPTVNVLGAGNANTPITGMLRHFSRLIVFKTDGAFSASSSTVTLADGNTVVSFYLTPVQRDTGNDAPGQVRLVYNNPRSVSGTAVYEWKSSGGYMASLDERVVKRLSQRVEATLQKWDLSKTVTFDDNHNMEWYLFHDGEALVNNYENDTWYFYDNLPVACMERHGGELYFGTPGGQVMRFSHEYRNDNGAELDAYWESGAMDFDAGWKLKYLSDVWIGIEPEANGRVTASIRTDMKNGYQEKTIASGLASLANMNFAHFSFNTNREPKTRRMKVKAKKFTFATLIFFSRSTASTATILETDMKIRYTGNVKK